MIWSAFRLLRLSSAWQNLKASGDASIDNDGPDAAARLWAYPPLSDKDQRQPRSPMMAATT
jgi:hypothetical protein